MDKVELLAEFTVPAVPPSYTASFKINYALRQTYLSQEARRFKDRVKVFMPTNRLTLTDSDRLIMHNQYHYDWYYKNGNIKKKDVQNMNRLLIDSVFKGLSIDDKNLFAVIDEKVQDTDIEKTVVRLYLANNVVEYFNSYKGGM